MEVNEFVDLVELLLIARACGVALLDELSYVPEDGSVDARPRQLGEDGERKLWHLRSQWPLTVAERRHGRKGPVEA